MRKLANIGIATGISMILYGPNADLAELLRVAIPLFLILQIVESIKQRARERRLDEFQARTRAEQRKIQELLGL